MVDLLKVLQNWNWRSNQWFFALVLCALALIGGQARARDFSESMPLYLEVTLNNHPTHLIASFMLLRSKQLAIMPDELEELSIRLPGLLKDHGQPVDNGLVVLDEIPDLTYDYDMSTQSIRIFLPASGLIHKSYDASKRAKTSADQSSTGLVLNYGLTGSLNSHETRREFNFSGASLSLDSHLFGSWGMLDASAIIGSTALGETSFLRLNTTWSYSDPSAVRAWRAGDIISGGLSWTRPVRLGGVQVKRNFKLRPDLITMPLPSVSGSAAIPSTVDIYVNNIRTYSQDVDAGTFTLNNLPVISDGSTARMVVRDATGREVQTSTPFFTSANLLRSGLFDYSFEAGVARSHFGSRSNEYSEKPAASASVRYGVNDIATLEAHGEGTDGLINLGTGVALNLGMLGEVLLAGSVSHHDNQNAGQFFSSINTEFSGFRIMATTQRKYGNYSDLASVVDEHLSKSARTGKAAVAIDRISLVLPKLIDGTSMNLGYIHTEYENEEDNHIFNASFSHRLTDRASFFASGFHDFSGDRNIGFYAGISISLGDKGHANLGASSTSVSTSYSKTARSEPGSIGWSLRDSEGKNPNRQASLTYQGAKGKMRAGILQNGHSASAQVYFDGAVVLAGDEMFLSNRINDAFAVVDVGANNVEVLYQNRPVGRTNANGKLLVPGLLSNQKNKITINPRDLPVNTSIPITETTVIPADHSGVVVNFKVRTADAAALIVIKSDGGKAIPAGAEGKLVATGESFVIGYDGQAYISNLSASNKIEINLPEGMCRASFAFKARTDQQVKIEDVICR